MSKDTAMLSISKTLTIMQHELYRDRAGKQAVQAAAAMHETTRRSFTARCHRSTLAMRAHTHETTCHHLVYGAFSNISVLQFRKDAVQTVIPQGSITEWRHCSPSDDLLVALETAASGGMQAPHRQSMIHFAVPS